MRIQSSLYYGFPGVREICTFIEYAAEKTTLLVSDWILCTDVEAEMITAKISHNINSIKPTGKLVSRMVRIMISMCMLIALVLIILLPLIIFSDASIKNDVYELVSGNIQMDLYVDSGKKLVNLFTTYLLLENRKLTPVERLKLSNMPNVGKLDLDHMRTFSFGAWSQRYLQLETDGKQYITKKLQEVVDDRISIRITINFKVKTFFINLFFCVNIIVRLTKKTTAWHTR